MPVSRSAAPGEQESRPAAPRRVPAGLVRAAQKGNAQAVEELFGRLRPVVLGWCERIAGQDADDVAQEVLLAVHRGLPRLRQPDRLVYWARQITRRELRRGAAKQLPQPVAEPPESPSPSVMETGCEITDVLRGLSPEHTRILALRFVLDYDEHAAAEFTGVSLGTAKSRQHRARSMFRRAWDEACRG